ncbi:MAG: o-succinylbenzoate synthase [Pseudanabaenaceae cyanobacterium bins.39]|nr:o-succinylbenzoate synthase [Pseudanabaenaceae cyanobacterium bins.39]
MLIKSIAFDAYILPWRSPLQTARGEMQCREGFIIQAIADGGWVGYGETAPIDGFGMESLARAAIVLQHLQEILIDIEINSFRDIPASLNHFLDHVFSQYGHCPAVRHGLELALLDLWSKYEQRSLPHLLIHYLGGEIREPKVNAVIGAIAPDLAAIRAEHFVKQGFDCLKIKVGSADFADDWQRVRAVRSRVGAEIQIRIDANQAWSVPEAIAHLKQLASLDIEYVEQPVAAVDLAGMAEVRRSQPILVAADESVNSLEQLHNAIALQAADIIIIKPMVIGGILTAHEAATIAHAANLDVVITTTLDGQIACQAAIDLASTLPIYRACGLSTHHLAINYSKDIF